MSIQELFTCSKCLKTFDERRRYTSVHLWLRNFFQGLKHDRQHQKTHSRPNKCKTCPKSFASRTDLVRHISNVHRIGNTIFSCTFVGCKFTSKRKDNLAQHSKHCHHRPRTSPNRNTKAVEDPLALTTASSNIANIEDTDQKLGWRVLMEAASTGNISLLDGLLAQGIAVNANAQDGYTAMHCAARTGQVAMIRHLLTKGCNIDAPNIKMKNRRPIHEAIISKDVAAVAALVCAGADLLLQASDDRTIFDYAASTMDLPLAQALFQPNEEPLCTHEKASLLITSSVKAGNASLLRWLLSTFPEALPQPNGVQRAPLFSAMRRGQHEVVEVLLAFSNPASKSNKYFVKAASCVLPYAAEGNLVDMVQALLACSDINVNQGCRDGETALHYAARNGNEQIVRILLGSEGINVNSACRNGRTPLHEVSLHGHVHVAKLLLSHEDINVNSKIWHNGSTPLFLAAKHGYLSIVELLLAHASVVSQCKDRNGQTPLAAAFFSCSWDVLHAIAQHQGTILDLNVEATKDELPTTNADQFLAMATNLLDRELLSKDPSKWGSIAKMAVMSDTAGVVKFLFEELDFNVNHDIRDELGAHRMLHLAIQHHCHDIFQLCLEHPKVKINEISYGRHLSVGGSALHYTVKFNNMTAFKLLLTHPEIDVTLRAWCDGRDGRDKTALDLAKRLERHEMIKLLSQHRFPRTLSETNTTTFDLDTNTQLGYMPDRQQLLQTSVSPSYDSRLGYSEEVSDSDDLEEEDMVF
jgi:ankyrin repeat protein